MHALYVEKKKKYRKGENRQSRAINRLYFAGKANTPACCFYLLIKHNLNIQTP